MDHKVTRCKCGAWKVVDATCKVCEALGVRG